MLTLVSIGIAVLVGLISISVTVLLVEVAAAVGVRDQKPFRPQNAVSKRVDVLVPAHNESLGIIPTIQDIKSQLKPGDRLVVVADNCTDDTAAVASSAAAEVIVRNDLERIGKGYALGWGIDHLSADPPDFVVFIDADCRVEPDVIATLEHVCQKLRRPIQASFLMKTAEKSTIDHAFAEFAFLLRNWVRPLGLRNLNGPVQLMGTGMIFPWDIIRSAPLASGHLVEDLKLGLDLASAGKAPYFLQYAKVTSDFPVTAKGTESQRQRWVQGHLSMILRSVPRLMLAAITRRNVDLFLLVLDLLVPPLSLLGFLVVGTFLLAALTSFLGLPHTLLLISTFNLLAFTLAVILAWVWFGRAILPARKIRSIGPLVLSKLRLYSQLVLGRTADKWIRTDRGKSE